jgi:hypothetical protein
MQLLTEIVQDDEKSAFATAGLVLLSAVGFLLLLWSQQTQLLGAAYLATSVLIAAWLYATSSPLYLGFVLWLWFLTPFIRRVIDYALGTYTPPARSLVMLTPFAASILTLLDIPRFGGQMVRRRYLPFLLCLLGILYGYVLGIFNVGAFGATRQLLSWLPPLLTGFYVMNRWQLAEAHTRVIKRTLTWGVLFLGVYGIAQFQLAPPWDAFWMQNTAMESIGQPYPGEVRIFSTLDSPGPFAVTVTTGLIVLFAGRGFLPILAAIPGYVSFLIVGVRGAWIGWMVALGTIVSQVRGQLRNRLFGVLVAVTLVTVPVVLTGDMGERTTNRIQTLENLEQDGSFKARVRLYSAAPARILMNPVGWGLGSRTMDSGILTLFWQLGWPGSLLYLTGLALLLWDVFQGQSFFAKVVMGVAASYAIQFFAGAQLLSQITGVLFWSLSSLAVAYHVYNTSRRRREVAVA